MEQARRRCARLIAQEGGDPAEFTEQRVLRALLGSDLDVEMALAKLRHTSKWRSLHRINQVRADLVMQLATITTSPLLMNQAVVNDIFPVRPCSLITTEGYPVTVWKMGQANGGAVSKVSTPDIEAWSFAFYEYVDLWLTCQSELTGNFAGHIQVFDLSGLGFFQVTNSALAEKLKAVLSTGSNYAESVSHIFVINSSPVFSMAWKVVKTLITPRTASKIVVANDVPDELFELVGRRNVRNLQALLGDGKAVGIGLQRPPKDVVEYMNSSMSTL